MYLTNTYVLKNFREEIARLPPLWLRACSTLLLLRVQRYTVCGESPLHIPSPFHKLETGDSNHRHVGSHLQP